MSRLSSASPIAALALIVALAVAPAAQAKTETSAGPYEYGCPIFPANNALNEEIASAPVNANSAQYIESIGLTAHLHPDFGRNKQYGIPFEVVSEKQAKVAIKFTEYARRIGARALSDSAQREGRGRRRRRRPPRARAAARHVHALRAVRRAAQRLGLEREQRRGIQPAQQRATPGRLDVGRCGRPADLAAARALSGGRERRDQARAARHRAAHAEGIHPPGDALRRRAAPTRACRRWACACA